MKNVEPGTLLRLRKFTAHGMDDSSETVGAPQNEVFVCVLLGTEQWKGITGTTLNINKVMAELGWTRIEELD